MEFAMGECRSGVTEVATSFAHETLQTAQRIGRVGMRLLQVASRQCIVMAQAACAAIGESFFRHMATRAGHAAIV